MTSELARLEAWYTRQCNGEWEHAYGVSVETLDNPGWLVSIDLSGTKLAGVAFPPVAENVGEDQHPRSGDWLSCRVDGARKGAGDPAKLRRIVHEFVTWAEEHES